MRAWRWDRNLDEKELGSVILKSSFTHTWRIRVILESRKGMRLCHMLLVPVSPAKACPNHQVFFTDAALIDSTTWPSTNKLLLMAPLSANLSFPLSVRRLSSDPARSIRLIFPDRAYLSVSLSSPSWSVWLPIATVTWNVRIAWDRLEETFILVLAVDRFLQALLGNKVSSWRLWSWRSPMKEDLHTGIQSQIPPRYLSLSVNLH